MAPPSRRLQASVSGSPATDATRAARLRSWIVIIGTLALAAIAGSSALDVWRAYHQHVSAIHRGLDNLAKALAEHAEGSVQLTDLLLRETAVWYQNERPGPGNAADIKLAARAAGLPQVREVRIFDEHGMPRFRSRHLPGDDAAISDRPYFVAHRDHPRLGVVLSDPLITEIERRPAIVMSRRLEKPDGTFDGIVQAVVDLEEFQRIYAAIDLGPGSAINLLRADGTLLVRQPRIAELVGRRFPEMIVPGADPSGLVSDTIDRRPRIVGVALVGEFPLALAVSRDVDVALEDWRDEAWHVAVRTLILVLLGAAAMVALVRQLRRVEVGERALRQSQKLEAMGTLAGGIAHDFNNILGAILGYGELAQKASPEGGAARRYLDNVLQAGGRAKALVERILAFSRSGVGERGPVNVQSVIEETLELLAASLPAGVRLERRLDAGDAAIVGDATQLHQVAMNLGTNALQAMAEGGVLEVTLDRVDVPQRRRLSHGELAAGSYVRLCVSDTGSGIPPDVLDRIFDPFFTTKNVGEGTGLGLSLVHGIATDLGGAIDVRTVVGQGTTFAVWLPVAGETPAPSTEAAARLPHGRGQTVMIVDDERALVALSEEMLADLGYEPVGFTSSVAALEAFREAPERFDIVLSDETMPELTGTALADKIRELRPDVPVVLMSGYAGTQMLERARGAGISEVLRKPLQSKDIAECFGRVLRSNFPISNVTLPPVLETPP